jgi:hypothetical protein
MGVTTCCGSSRENMFETYLISVFKTSKISQLKFENLYKLLTEKNFPDPNSNEVVDELVSSIKLDLIFKEYFINEKSEFKDIQTELCNKISKRMLRKNEDMVKISKVFLRFVPFLADDDHLKVYYFFACCNTDFKIEENRQIQIESVNNIIRRLLKYNLVELTEDFIDIIKNRDIYHKLVEDINKVRDHYKDIKISDYVDSKFNFANRCEELEKIIRAVRSHSFIFFHSELRANFLFYHMSLENPSYPVTTTYSTKK